MIGCKGFVDFRDDIYLTNQAGAVVVYNRSSLTGDPFLKLSLPILSLPTQFGYAVSINAAGILAVGSQFGSVYIYDLTSSNPNTPQTLTVETAPYPRQNNFGSSVAINDSSFIGKLAVGAIKQDGKGAVYLYRNLNTDPEKISAPNSVTNCVTDSNPDNTGCQFGFSVALFENTLVVGAPGSLQGAGMAFVYDMTLDLDDMIANVKSLPPTGGGGATPQTNAEFGRSVAITNGAIVVGSRKYQDGLGAVFFYNQNANGNWYRPEFDNENNPIVGTGNQFGTAVAIGETAFTVGVPNVNDQGGEARAYSYKSANPEASNSDTKSSNRPPTPSPVAVNTPTNGQSANDTTTTPTGTNETAATPTGANETTSSPTEELPSQEEIIELDTSDDCILAYRINDWDASAITIELTCENVDEKWVGIGFSSDGSMQNSEAVLGIPGNDTPLKYNLNGKSAAAVVQMPEHKQTLIDASLEVDNDGRTVMKFTKLMKEEGEIEIKAGEEIYLLYARGMNSNLGYHAERLSVKLTL